MQEIKENTQIDTAPVFISNTTGSKYDVPDVREYIAYMSRDNASISEITEGLKERGYPNITPGKVSELQKLVIARATIQSNTVSEQFEEFQNVLLETYQDAIKALGEYIKSIRVLQKEFNEIKNEEGDLDIVKAKMAIFKTIPQAVTLMKELRGYIEFNTDMVNAVKTTTKEGVIVSTEQILEEVNKMAPIIMAERIKEYMKSLKLEYGESIPVAKLEKELLALAK